MSKLKICFVDFWKGFDSSNNFLIDFLNNYFEVELSNEPDYCIFSNYGFENLKFNHCIKIQFVGENMVPDFNLADYALGFHHLDFGDRYLRFPLYIVYGNYFIPGAYKALRQEKVIENTSELLNRKFCNFVYSNAETADPIRKSFFEALSKYKKVDAGGKYLNNIGYQIPDKMDFIKDYKFTIAFENSVCEGYTTEKIFEPMVMKSVPIYFGNPLVDRDFNSDTFVWLKNPSKIKETIEEIIHLDSTDNDYLAMLSKPSFSEEQLKFDWEYELKKFFENIFSQDRHKVKRTAIYGYNQHFSNELNQMSLLRNKQKRANKWKATLSSTVNFLRNKDKNNK